MEDRTSNDNEAEQSGAVLRGPDAHGQAALLLVESLLHGLVARSVISVADAIEIIEIATDVKQEIAGDLGDSPANLEKSLGLLAAIDLSIRNDLMSD